MHEKPNVSKRRIEEIREPENPFALRQIVNVRSQGEIESGWRIVDFGIRENGEKHAVVQKGSLEKKVSINELVELNPLAAGRRSRLSEVPPDSESEGGF